MFKEAGKGFTDFLNGLYNGTDLLVKTLAASFQKPFEKENVRDQMYEIGARSFPVSGLTSLFTGMVLALQSGYSSISVFNEPLYVGTVVTFSLVKELSPVLTATVIMGRVGAAITAEIGTMKVTEQIDALYTLGTNPIRYLAVPRFISCVLMLPLLTVFSDIIGVIGGFLVSKYVLDIPSTIYWSNTFDYLGVEDFFHGFIKAGFFGVLIAVISIYKGFRCSGGAEGVGKATTSAVVTVIVLILVSDYFLSSLLVAIGIG